MAFIQDLPLETLLSVLSYLNFWDITKLQRLSREWRELVQSNEEFIYHHLSWMHGMIPNIKTDLDVAMNSLAEPRPEDVSWKTFCKHSHNQHLLY